jgi:FKBP-type peptidyl-prolyl cis-trans isomerase
MQDARRDLGLEVTDLKVGTGDEIKGGQTATIGYIGTLANGKVFDQVLALLALIVHKYEF